MFVKIKTLMCIIKLQTAAEQLLYFLQFPYFYYTLFLTILLILFFLPTLATFFTVSFPATLFSPLDASHDLS